MAPRIIDHFAPGLFGGYKGHSVVHDNGEVDHYEHDGSLIPGERYVGRSVIKDAASGGRGSDIDASLLPWFLLVPLVFLVAIPLLVICPGLWLVWRAFRKKGEDHADKGAGWVILAVFMIMFGAGLALNMLALLPPVFPKDHISSAETGFLIAAGVAASWALSLLVAGFDILRKAHAVTIIWVVAILLSMWAIGNYLRKKSISPAIVTHTSEISETRNAMGGRPMSRISDTVRQFPEAAGFVNADF